MSTKRFYNVFAGKPSRLVPSDSSSTQTLEFDLLWIYPFDWLYIDLHSDIGIQDVETGELVSSIPIDVCFSSDGVQFQNVNHSEIRKLSPAASRGSYGGVRVIFGSANLSRKVRIESPIGIDFTVRSGLTHAELIRAENRKHTIFPVRTQRSGASLLDVPMVTIAGASNSVMRQGWVDGLRVGGLDLLANVSLGSSSNAMLATRLTPAALVGADYLLLDTTVTEYRPIRDGLHNPAVAETMLNHSAALARESGATPIFVIFPHQSPLRDQQAGEGEFTPSDYYAELCERLGFPYIDGFKILSDIVAHFERPAFTMFKDDAHLSRAIAQVFGYLVARLILDHSHVLRSAASHRSLPARGIVHHVRLAEHLPKGGAFCRPVRNSLIDEVAITVSERGVTFEGLPDGYLVAFTINARHCNSSVRFTSEGAVSRRLDFAGYDAESDAPFVCVRTLMRPIRIREGSLSKEAIRPAIQHEADHLTGDLERGRDVSSPQIELVDLVIVDNLPPTAGASDSTGFKVLELIGDSHSYLNSLDVSQ